MPKMSKRKTALSMVQVATLNKLIADGHISLEPTAEEMDSIADGPSTLVETILFGLPSIICFRNGGYGEIDIEDWFDPTIRGYAWFYEMKEDILWSNEKLYPSGPLTLLGKLAGAVTLFTLERSGGKYIQGGCYGRTPSNMHRITRARQAKLLSLPKPNPLGFKAEDPAK